MPGSHGLLDRIARGLWERRPLACAPEGVDGKVEMVQPVPGEVWLGGSPGKVRCHLLAALSRSEKAKDNPYL